MLAYHGREVALRLDGVWDWLANEDWKQYQIDLTGLDMSHIIGGFGFAANSDSNPNGFTMYLDEIRLEK